MYKRVFILFIVLLFSACGRYTVGSINILRNYNGPDALSYFNYRILPSDDILIEARIGAIKYKGNVFKVRNNNQLGKNVNSFSVLRMRSDDGKYIECFITQKSKRNFGKGGNGTCYSGGLKMFDIYIQPSKSYVSSRILRSFVE